MGKAVRLTLSPVGRIEDVHRQFNHLVEDVQVLVDNTLVYFGAKRN